MSYFGAEAHRHEVVPALLSAGGDLEFFPVGNGYCSTAENAMHDFLGHQNDARFYYGGNVVFMHGPPHIIRHDMAKGPRYSWRHWIAWVD